MTVRRCITLPRPLPRLLHTSLPRNLILQNSRPDAVESSDVCDEAVRARQNQRFARKQAAREHDSRLVAALAERSKAALKRCQAAEKKVRACARAAKLAAGDARHIEGLVRDARRRAPPPAVTPAAA